MNSKNTLLIAACALALGLLPFLLTVARPAPSPRVRQEAKVVIPEPAPTAVPAPRESPAVPELPAIPERTLANPQDVQSPLPINASSKAMPRTRQPVDQDPPTTDQLARDALNFVGLDPDAEEYWSDAINDLSLPSEERRNLIEDLNEDGLSDPQHPTAVDLPLIISRLYLIEELAPDALDQANAEAFAEAHKDLRNMFLGLTGRAWSASP